MSVRILFGKLLLFCACLLTLLCLYRYNYGEWSRGGYKDFSLPVANIWSPRDGVLNSEKKDPNTSRSGEKTKLTTFGFNMTAELIRLNPKIFSALPREFLPNYKNPCWFDKSMKSTSDKGNRTGDFLLRCLPFVYIIGQPKCGTTDLFYRITQHPDVVQGLFKEPHWWTRMRFKRNQDFEDYLDYFRDAALAIGTRSKKDVTSSGQEYIKHDVITVEGSASTMWDNRHWRQELWDTSNNEPPILIANLIRTVQPNARIIITLRNPTDRLYSEYFYFGKMQTNKSVKNFHRKVTSAITNYRNCLRKNSVRSCAYQHELWIPGYKNVRVRLGLYEVYLRDWFSIFPRDQILVQRLEDHSKDPKVTMTRIFKFLQLEKVRNKNETMFSSQKIKRKSRKRKYINMGPMLPETRKVLDRFYRPYNRRLAKLLNNTGFLWLKD